MTPCKKKLDLMSLADLANLLSYYNIYDTTKRSGEDTRPSGPEMKAYLQERLRGLDKTIPKPKPVELAYIHFDLNVIDEDPGYGLNLLQRLEDSMLPYLHNGNRAMRRKPREYAREVVLELMHEGLIVNGKLASAFILELHEGNYIPKETKMVHARGVDWVIFTNQIVITP